jgi:hypothetical protein
MAQWATIDAKNKRDLPVFLTAMAEQAEEEKAAMGEE